MTDALHLPDRVSRSIISASTVTVDATAVSASVFIPAGNR